MDDERFRVLHALKLRGVADLPAIRDMTGYDDTVVGEVLGTLVEAESVRQRTGRVGGYALTQAGRELHGTLLAQDTDDAVVASAERAYDEFLPVNGTFKQLCTEWQSGDDRAAVLDRLGQIHDRLAPSLEEVGRGIPRFCRYGDRLDDRLARIRDGDADAFLKPMTGSYHDVWMELHADLLLAARRERGAHDE